MKKLLQFWAMWTADMAIPAAVLKASEEGKASTCTSSSPWACSQPWGTAASTLTGSGGGGYHVLIANLEKRLKWPQKIISWAQSLKLSKQRSIEINDEFTETRYSSVWIPGISRHFQKIRTAVLSAPQKNWGPRSPSEAESEALDRAMTFRKHLWFRQWKIASADRLLWKITIFNGYINHFYGQL